HDYLFVQGMSGVKSLIEIPYLDEFGANTELAVNWATMSFEVADVQPDYLELSPQLYLLDYEIEQGGTDTIETLTLDYTFSTTRYGGIYDESAKTYTFDVTRQVQKIIDNAKMGKDVNLGFTLNAQVPVLNDNREHQNALKGSDNIVFKVYYTDISK
ncbi:MAG: DUF4270 family protein, partial [Salibacteraceae bacterium]